MNFIYHPKNNIFEINHLLKAKICFSVDNHISREYVIITLQSLFYR